MNNALIIRGDIEPGGRLKVSVVDAHNNLIQADGVDLTLSLAKFNRKITVGIETTFNIVGKHFSDTYTVSTTNGTVKVVGNQVKYTPSEVGTGGFLLNGTMHNVEVIKNAPVRPALVAPTKNAESVTVYPVLASTAYDVEDTSILHTASRWQIATDPEFINVVVDVESASALNTFISSELERGVTYYARVMHIGTKP